MPQDAVNAKMQQDHGLSCNSNEQVQLGEKSADTCTSTLTLIRVILCVVFIYECYFDLIDHLPIETFSVRVVIAVIFRVQSSLYNHNFKKKIVSSLITICTICKSANTENDIASKAIQPDSICTLFHIMRFRTKKTQKNAAGFKEKLEECFEQNFKF